MAISAVGWRLAVFGYRLPEPIPGLPSVIRTIYGLEV